MPKRKASRKKRLPQVKKDIKDFLLSEEGKVSKKNIAKLGMSLAVLGMMIQPDIASAQHTNAFFFTGPGGHNSGHANHGNHGQGGWC